MWDKSVGVFRSSAVTTLKCDWSVAVLVVKQYYYNVFKMNTVKSVPPYSKTVYSDFFCKTQQLI